MFVLRATAKLRHRLRQPAPGEGEGSTTLLGDWYATMLPWRPQVALLVNERTLLPVLMPLAPAASMPARVADHVGQVLTAQGVPDAVVVGEVERMRRWRVAPTASRSVVGIMNEFAFLAAASRGDGTPNLLELAARLADMPCGPLYGRHVSPDRELAALVQGIS